MDIFTIVFWVVALLLFGLSMRKGKARVKQAMKQSRSMMKTMIGDIVGIIFLIGLVLTFIPPSSIEAALGSSNTLWGSAIAAIAGSITLIPAFVAFPLVGSLVQNGASIIPAAAFLTTLTMVGVVTFPLEKREFGTKFALARNLLSFVAALMIAALMGVIL